MPGFDTDELMGCIKELVSIDKEWIDAVDELDQFYTRMVHFSTDKTLGVRSAQNTKLLVLLNPLTLK